mmetsp:Transcript_7712/g.16949  ORF Transcript_7712/g.16949 Transcript_7712/m.16949 type:complete len:207 (+) Transcript_7712:154-774(+)
MEDTTSLNSLADKKDGTDFYDPELATHGGPYTSKFEIGQVTIRRPLDCRLVPMSALAISFVPWLAPFAAVAFACFGQKPFLGVYALILSGTCAILSEIVMKPIIGEPRPATSAVRTSDGRLKNGMPSGHVLNWQALSTWVLLELFVHISFGLATGLSVILAIMMALVPWARVQNGDHTLQQVSVGAGTGTAVGLLAFGVRLYFFVE